MRVPTPLLKALAIIVLATNFCSAQTQKIDSIKNLMKTADDTTMVNLIRRQGIYTQNQSFDEARNLIQQSIEKAIQIGYIRGEIKGLNSMAVSYGMAGDYPEALNYFRQSLALAIEHKKYRDISYAYGNLGILYKRIGDYPTSQEYYLKGLKLVDSLNLNNDEAANIYINLGNLYDLMGQQDKAIESYEQGLKVVSDMDRVSYEQDMLRNLAVMDMENKDYEAALDKLLRNVAFLETQEQVDEITLTTVYSNIGNCYFNLGQWRVAENYLTKSLRLAKKLDLKQEISLIFQNLAELRFREERYTEAIDYSNKNLQTLEGMSGAFNRRKEAHDIAFQIHKGAGNLPKALYHLNQTMAYKDSLLNETKVREIQNLQVQHDVYLKDRELKENELQLALLNTQVALNNKRLAYLAIIIILLLLSAALLYFRFTAKKKANIVLQNKNQLISQQKEVIEQMNLELEKRMLRAQMNPHFIFNSLSSIHHLISSNDRNNALHYLGKFSKLLRNVLESSINVSLSLKDEIELLKIYLELESLRFDNSFAYTIHIDENLDINEHEVPMLLVQPYLENAIMHGLMPKDGKKELSIAFNDKMEYVQCIIEDNGVGIDTQPAKKISKRPSRGMSITAGRINALKKFSNEELVNVESLNDGDKTGTRVTILIPKRQLVENIPEPSETLAG